MSQHVGRCFVGEVSVLDDQQARIGEQISQQIGCHNFQSLFTKLLAYGVGCRGRRHRRVGHHGQQRQPVGQRGHQGVHRGSQRRAGRRRIGLVRDGEQVTKKHPERRIRGERVVRVARDDDGAEIGIAAPDLLHQPRFPDAGLADHLDERPPSGAHIGDHSLEHSHLALAPDQRDVVVDGFGTGTDDRTDAERADRQRLSLDGKGF